MTDTATWTRFGDEEFVELTTFRRNGTPVGAPVWIAPAGDELVVTTVDGTGKVKRLRHAADIELRPCSRRGTVEPDAPVLRARAVVDSDPAVFERADRALRQKYGWQYTAFTTGEKLLRRGEKQRVILRITPAS